MLIKELVEQNRVCFHDNFENWEDAIVASCKPLIDDNSIGQEYVNSVIESVHKFGPYIVFAPNIAMPHSQQGAEGVYKTAISFMKVENPVHFEVGNPEKDAKLFFVLASENPEVHLKNMQKLVEILMDENMLNGLLKAKCTEDLLKLDV